MCLRLLGGVCAVLIDFPSAVLSSFQWCGWMNLLSEQLWDEEGFVPEFLKGHVLTIYISRALFTLLSTVCFSSGRFARTAE